MTPGRELKIVGLGGSLAPRSTSLAALKVALQGAIDAGAATEVLDVGELDLPFYVPRSSKLPPSAERLINTVYEADGLVWSSPLYHGTVSGSFKNVLDWLDLLGDRDPPYLSGKVIGLISTAGGTQGLQAINTMEFVVRALRAWAVPLVLPIPQAWQAFDDGGQAKDAKIEEQLRTLGQEVARAARQFMHEGRCDYAEWPTRVATREA